MQIPESGRAKNGQFTSKQLTKHGHACAGKITSEYNTFKRAKQKCTNPRATQYKDYGGRGIKFLFKSFQDFFRELGRRPCGKVLDRINNDGHYESGNVRWATRTQSSRNRRHPMFWANRSSYKLT
jgi:hypothetical protein